MAASSPWVGSLTPPHQPAPPQPQVTAAQAPLTSIETGSRSELSASVVTETSTSLVPPAVALSDLDPLKDQATEALANTRNQTSAADAVADSAWTLADNELRIQTEVSKTMLPMVINPEADKILRATLRNLLPPGTKVTLLPGTASASAAKKPRPARSGSAQAKALEHPVVQQAQRLFDAEIRTVIDLREN